VPSASGLSLAADSTSVYWSFEGIYWAPVTGVPEGGAPASVWDFASSGLTLDATNVYWVNTAGDVKSMPKSGPGDGGSAVVTIASGQGNLQSIAVDASHAYVTTGSPSTNTLMRVPLLGGVVDTLVSGGNSSANVVVNATSVGWIEAAGVVHVITPK